MFEISKAIVKMLWMENPNTLDADDTSHLYLSGYGLGGYRASMVSMWLSTTVSKKFSTYAFNSPGQLCQVFFSPVLRKDIKLPTSDSKGCFL
jgi:hypothetical protein